MLSPIFRLNKATNQARTATVFHGTTQVALYTAPAAMDDPRGPSKWCLKIGHPQTYNWMGYTPFSNLPILGYTFCKYTLSSFSLAIFWGYTPFSNTPKRLFGIPPPPFLLGLPKRYPGVRAQEPAITSPQKGTLKRLPNHPLLT